MAEINAQDWLHWYSGRASQDHATRLSCFCSSIFPTDSQLAKLAEEHIVAELIGLSLHGRRTMERASKKDAAVSPWGFWPSSKENWDQGLNLWSAFGRVIHASSIRIGWEPIEGLDPYQGREARFAGHVVVTSDKGTVCLAPGAMAASYLGSVLNQLGGRAA